MFGSVLIANRGEIACRVIATAKRMGLKAYAVYSEADAKARHVAMADGALAIGPAAARASYLNGAAVLDAAKRLGAEAIHPGYGFLSENADFAQAVLDAGLIWIGAPPDAIRAMGLKDRAKALMRAAGVPIVPGEFGDNQDAVFLARRADDIGYPVMIKAVAGGGGKGMRKVMAPADFAAALEGAKREGQSAFGDARVMIEKFVTAPRHIEVQVFADSHGNVVHIFERDCSLQRRHQKVIEEAPAPGMTQAFRAQITNAAIQAAKSIGYVGAGTVEFIADGGQGLDPAKVYFLEMNTRLQVEHPVSEMITGLDLVEWQLRVAAGEALPKTQDQIAICGHAMEARLYAEDPAKGFLPQIGRLERLRFASQARIDTGVREGDEVTVHYDPMIAKVIAHGPDRVAAAKALAGALKASAILGVETNAAFLARLALHPTFLAGEVETGFIERHLEALVERRPVTSADIVLALLAFKADLDNNAQGDWSPFAVLDGFRANLAPAERVRVRVDGAVHDVLVSRVAGTWTFTFEGPFAGASHQGNAQLGAAGALSARLDGQKIDAIVYLAPAGAPSLVALSVDGFSFKTEIVDPARAAEDAGGAGGRVLAPMPGKVIAVAVKPGDKVRQGDPIAILEAMKMEHTLTAPGDGLVETVAVAVGEQLADGALVASITAEA